MPLVILYAFILLSLSACGTSMERPSTNHSSSSGPVGIIVKEVKSYGRVINIDMSNRQIEIKHAPIPELNWAPMLMKFQVADNIRLSPFTRDDLVDITLEFDKNENYRIKSLSHR